MPAGVIIRGVTDSLVLRLDSCININNAKALKPTVEGYSEENETCRLVRVSIRRETDSLLLNCVIDSSISVMLPRRPQTDFARNILGY